MILKQLTGSSTGATLPVYEEYPEGTETYYADTSTAYTAPLLSADRRLEPIGTEPSTHPQNPFHSPHDPPSSRCTIADLNPSVYDEKAEARGNEGKKGKKRRLHPLLKGVLALTVACPAVVVVAAGTVIWGVGQLLVGVGDLMTGGPLKETARKAWEERRAARRAEKRAAKKY